MSVVLTYEVEHCLLILIKSLSLVHIDFPQINHSCRRVNLPKCDTPALANMRLSCSFVLCVNY